jgi:hypothetical protein
MYYCKRKMYSAVNFYFDDIVVDVVTIREKKSKFSLTLFIKKRVVTVNLGSDTSVRWSWASLTPKASS